MQSGGIARMPNAIGQYCRIQITNEDKTLKSPLIPEAWKAQVH